MVCHTPAYDQGSLVPLFFRNRRTTPHKNGNNEIQGSALQFPIF